MPYGKSLPLFLAATVLAATPGLAQTTGNGEEIIVVDAPDVQKVDPTRVPGFRTSEVIGMEVYSNAGKHIGEVDDFLMSGNGYFYAVVDTEEGEIIDAIDITDGDVVVIPWNQLRVSTSGSEMFR